MIAWLAEHGYPHEVADPPPDGRGWMVVLFLSAVVIGLTAIETARKR